MIHNPRDLLRAIAFGLAFTSLIFTALVATQASGFRAAGTTTVATAVVTAGLVVIGFLLVATVFRWKTTPEDTYRVALLIGCITLCGTAGVVVLTPFNDERSALIVFAGLTAPWALTLGAWAVAAMVSALLFVAKILATKPAKPDGASLNSGSARATAIVATAVVVFTGASGLAVSHSAGDALVGSHTTTSDTTLPTTGADGELHAAYRVSTSPDSIYPGGPGFLVRTEWDVIAYHGETGTETWRFSFSGSRYGQSVPTSIDTEIQVVGSGEDSVVFLTLSEVTVALDGLTGKILWRFGPEVHPVRDDRSVTTSTVWTLPASSYVQREQYSGYEAVEPDNLTMVSLNGETNQIDWSVEVPCRPTSTALVGDIVAYVDCTKNVTLRDRATGEVIKDGIRLSRTGKSAVKVTPIRGELLWIHAVDSGAFELRETMLIDLSGAVVDRFDVYGTTVVPAADGTFAYSDPDAERDEYGTVPISREVLIRDRAGGSSTRTGVVAQFGTMASIGDGYLVATKGGAVTIGTDTRRTPTPVSLPCGPDTTYESYGGLPNPNNIERMFNIAGGVLVFCSDGYGYGIRPS